MSREETARMTSGCDGKRRSIFFVCWTPGSLVEKKKFSSTTGLRSTNVATSANNTPVIASINQYDPNGRVLPRISRFMTDRREIT